MSMRAFSLYAAVLLASVVASAIWPMGWAPDYGPVRTQPICSDNPQPGCVPLHRLT